jgi:CRP-like cAMP-binding protein
MGTDTNTNTCTVGKSHLNCFNQLTPEEIEIIENNSVEVTYEKGETICKQGSFASHIMMVEEGLAKIYIEGQGETLILKILPAGNIIGLSSLIEGNNVFQYSAQAYLKTRVKLMEINTFKSVIEANGKFATKVISLLSQNSVITFGRFFCLTKKQTYGRMADILLCLANRIYKMKKFPLQLSRKELAELASMSVETTVRSLTRFKEEKLIKMNKESIEILDFDRLTKISISG